ncbi:MAG: hypothetical protein NWF03_04505 [Candidatus Bathyarchaeota archaeon]|nr:hypothetical protein [Candidatus Bathyarchaeota archaeon]
MSAPKTARIKSWEEFKKTAIEQNAKTVVYVIAQSIPNNNYTGLKLILPVKGGQYIFVDSANGDRMRRTNIPIRTDRYGNRQLTDEDIIQFLKTSLGIPNIQIFSYWTA